MVALSSLEDTPPSPKRLCGSLWLPPSSLGLVFLQIQAFTADFAISANHAAKRY
jgi:hypothetical protein